MTTTHPLQWPSGWPRTSTAERIEGKHRFRRSTPNSSLLSPFWTLATARDALVEEVGRLNGGGPVVISTNFEPDRHGRPVEGRRRPDDQGVAIYFDLAGEQMAMACDRYVRAEENMRSLTLAIEAMRQLDRHGGGHMMRRAFQGFAALPSPRSHWDVLGLKPGALPADVSAAFKEKALAAHPDRGGSSAAMTEVLAAREACLRELGL